MMGMAKYENIIIQVLKKHGPLTPKAISEKTEINYNTVRGLVQRMVKKGLLRRRNRGVYEIA